MSIYYRGILFLVVTAFLGEGIEILVNMILARQLGSHGLGLYMSILPTILLIILISSFELPVSISKFIAEREERYHRNIMYHAITITIIFTSLLFVVGTVLLPFIPIFNSYHPYVRWLVIILIPVISFTSVARGYFMGRQQMGKIAISNFLRKIFQLAGLFVLFRFFEFNPESSLLIAIATLIGSEIVVFLYLVFMFIIQFKELRRQPFSNLNRKIVRKNLMAVSIPTTGMRLFTAFTNAVQPFIIKAALVHSGITAVQATEQFGMLMGVAISIGFFPGFIAHSLMIVLIPAVSKTHSERDFSSLQRMLQQVIILTLGYGIVAVTIFFFFAPELASLFFKSGTSATYLQLLWPFFLFHYFVIPLQAFMIGLDLIKEAFIHIIWSTVISFSLILVLGSMSEWRMDGVIIGMNTGSVLLALMHYFTVCKKIGVSVFTGRVVHQ
ncbi:oligosaccharide flippase family protein [Neobacillus sp. YIM B02564]|uniref:Oligosaccharide flippase family protein n=1 Tax=Neobacillus paridis TaxID=2803862 RepID=A0ABS1TR87_9BACI|nr:oligosaccharide flippase family protein [Neobacillus paridis]MBL4953673.1 oligosaccharide flippase family protein [Neobacillus paridis]